MATVRNILIGLFAFILIGVSWINAGTSALKSIGLLPSNSLAEQIEELALQMQRQLPLRIDDVTTITGVLAQGTKVTYFGTMNVAIPAHKRPDLLRYFKYYQVRQNCDSERENIIRGMEAEYAISDSAGWLMKFKVSNADCIAADGH